MSTLNVLLYDFLSCVCMYLMVTFYLAMLKIFTISAPALLSTEAGIFLCGHDSGSKHCNFQFFG